MTLEKQENKTEKEAKSVRIWVDADACPKVIKEILFKAADRRKIHTYFVANRTLYVPKSFYLHQVRVGEGADVADAYIVQQLKDYDIVITGDIPLAALVIEASCVALSPRGSLFTKENIQERLSIRNFADDLRGEGVMTGGSKPFSNKNKRIFAGAFDRILTQKLNELKRLR